MAAEFTIKATCRASADVVYDLLTDINTHLLWNGEQQAKDYRLLSLSAEPGIARAGTEFESTGKIPFSKRRWRDHSKVTIAERGRIFEFTTEGIVDFEDGQKMEAHFLHRYEIEARGTGSRVAYTMRLEGLKNGMWRITLPVLRVLTWKVGIPMATKPGLQNLLRMAEDEAQRCPGAAVQGA